MHKATAYEALARELEHWRSMPAGQLVATVGTPASTRNVTIDGEDIAIEVSAEWQGHEQDAVRITAVANGPSHWRLERLVESIVVRLQP